MFMEDGMPVFPTMHTYFMNADNLFRYDENIERMELVRGGASALFGSNTPGAMVNFINKTGGDEFAGTVRATGGTQGLARFDLSTAHWARIGASMSAASTATTTACATPASPGSGAAR